MNEQQIDMWGPAGPARPPQAEQPKPARKAKPKSQAKPQSQEKPKRKKYVRGKHTDWLSEAAKEFFMFLAAKQSAPFLTEEFVKHYQDAGLPMPPDKRLFGGLIRAMANAGHIAHAGYGLALSSHHSPKSRWRAA